VVFAAININAATIRIPIPIMMSMAPRIALMTLPTLGKNQFATR
jgi:hypothetical protein